MPASSRRTAAIQDFPGRHWYRLSPLSVALMPVALLMRAVVAARRFAYRRGLLPAERLPAPVVVVGNRIVGGAGKTPLVLWLARELAARGFRPGIVSRGYGGRARTPCEVPRQADPDRYGDEPVLLAERSDAPVWVGVDRVAAARGLLRHHPECDVVLCDDGLQHYRLARDFEICVEDARGDGNGLLLPAGPLREPPSREVDATVLNDAPPRPGTYAMRLAPAGLYALHDPARSVAPQALAGLRLHAAAAIGNPERFFATLRSMGLAHVAHAFRDHHAYEARDLAFPECDCIVVTEKDAVKLRRFQRDDIVVLRVQAQVDPQLADRIVEKLRGREAP
jgi:tetraacyldisaccharide 4'-kinase